MRDRQVFPQSSHFIHIITVDGVNDSAGAEEEQGFEEGVSEQVEHGCHVPEAFFPAVSRNTERQHHISDLRHCRICQNTFDIVLGTCYHRGK